MKKSIFTDTRESLLQMDKDNAQMDKDNAQRGHGINRRFSLTDKQQSFFQVRIYME